ncbi:V-type ATPase subunit [uncultured Anaerococcus sp.]|uniref:V0D/AC39 family V-type ATPase subunit n=1 Tax=uncultured Anaerococcus sp. TaxID=293428 RepID=UPI00261221C8|nr:V-type ATPase subunit [uncultured Anaerococcus sp.]
MRDVTVKAKAKMGKLPTDSFYNELIHEGNLDIKIDMLKSKYNFLAEATSKKSIESALFKHFYEELKSLNFFLKGIESEFFDEYFSIYEIFLIQECIQCITNNTLEKNLLNLVQNPFSKDVKIDIGMTLDEFIEGLNTSKYYRTLLPFINENMDKSSLIFLSSNALMKFYYRNLLKIAKKFKSKEKVLIENFVGELINLSNLEMLYRLKKFFNLNDNEIFNYLIEGGRGFNADKLKYISNLPMDEFLGYIATSKYKDLFLGQIDSYIQIKRKKMKMFKNEIISGQSDILYVISAMSIIHMNIKNLVSILEVDDSFTLSERYELVIVR